MGDVKLNSSGGGSVTLTTPSTASNLTVTLPSASGTLATTSGSLSSPTITGTVAGGATYTSPTLTGASITAANSNTVEATSGPTSTQLSGNRNKIINGAMMIDQRNAGAAVTTTGNFPVDRFYVNNATDATFSAQQSTDVPTGQGFVNSLKVTFPSGDASIGSTQYANIQHRIEGFNSADFAFGTAGAQSVTLSFWVKATVTGQYSYAIYNSAENRINPQSFTINASNTWEKKTITYTGDTSGTWLTNNGIGLNVTLYVALGSSYLGSSGWNSGGTYGVTGQANGLSSNGNIFAITGVQLEKGATATPFENRLYGTELALCQRYYWNLASGLGKGWAIGSYYSTTNIYMPVVYPVRMRTTPTLNATSGTDYYRAAKAGGNDTFNSVTIDNAGEQCCWLYNGTEASGTQGTAFPVDCNNASASISFQAEL